MRGNVWCRSRCFLQSKTTQEKEGGSRAASKHAAVRRQKNASWRRGGIGTMSKLVLKEPRPPAGRPEHYGHDG